MITDEQQARIVEAIRNKIAVGERSLKIRSERFYDPYVRHSYDIVVKAKEVYEECLAWVTKGDVDGDDRG